MKRVLKICSIILIIVGMVFCLFPQINNFAYNQRQKKIIKDYDERILKEIKKADTDTKNNSVSYQQFYDDVTSYNKALTKDIQSSKLSQKELYQIPALNLTKYGIENNMYGYIQIPKLDINMAIYLGASDYNLSKGTGHLPYTSLPIGGKDTNSIISGHCGYAGINMFRYISTLEIGDKVKVTTPFNKLTYKVTETDVIKPSEIDKLFIQSDKDMISLITCHPYPTNKYRFVVYCERKM